MLRRRETEEVDFDLECSKIIVHSRGSIIILEILNNPFGLGPGEGIVLHRRCTESFSLIPASIDNVHVRKCTTHTEFSKHNTANS